MKEKLFSVTLKDCDVSFYKGSGKGGQKRNKTSSACRVKHTPSGAIGQCEDHRSQDQNKKTAFKRMTESNLFQHWLKTEVLRVTGEIRKIEEKIEEDIHNPKKTKVEIFDNGKWIEPKRKEVKRKATEKNKVKEKRQESKNIAKKYKDI